MWPHLSSNRWNEQSVRIEFSALDSPQIKLPPKKRVEGVLFANANCFYTCVLVIWPVPQTFISISAESFKSFQHRGLILGLILSLHLIYDKSNM